MLAGEVKTQAFTTLLTKPSLVGVLQDLKPHDAQSHGSCRSELQALQKTRRRRLVGENGQSVEKEGSNKAG
jgi:hypothetical protein